MNILITGACGYLGSQLVQSLASLGLEEHSIIATDIREEPPAGFPKAITYLKADVRSKKVGELLEAYKIDTIVHLATIVTPGKKSNREFEYSVDVLGTGNILELAVQHHVKRIIVTSSGAAYGYHHDNPDWITEDTPICGNYEFSYSYHKRIVEKLMAEYRVNYPELEQVVFRIGTILGESVNNQITSLFEKKYMIGIRGSDSPFVFIWDQDVVACLKKAVFGEEVGVFNLAGTGAMTVDDIARVLNKKVIRFPEQLIKKALFVLKRAGLTQYGEEQVRFLQYRPVLSNRKLIAEFDYTPEKTTEEVFRYYCEHRFGKLRG
ncbi:SDR family oxidoreductase [Alkalihalobacillus pseudalcaliphilus]|uniref:SDR family oxidoreductase n=1 Tax=Alkalihalobacillus pseudalcaliphilus TaxID=79884 RepID=UPI00064DFB13|nr:SDR family oxidoreductase [Alkalihalobacillus pseudalcaliphilus]KMK76815.1 epimerase [Alkalihalobacillus pseudalcaliphilus]